MGRDLPPNWSSKRRKVLNRDDYTCGNCGRIAKQNNDVQLEVHHIVERQHGGTHQLTNLQTLCSDCHASITYNQPAPTAYAKFNSQQATFGTRKAHLWIFILFGWWTLGLSNLFYALYQYSSQNSNKNLTEMGGGFQQSIEHKESQSRDYNDGLDDVLFNGCPVCGSTLERVRLFPTMAFECTDCDARLERKTGIYLIARYTLVSGDSNHTGETYKLTKWRKMTPSHEVISNPQRDNT